MTSRWLFLDMNSYFASVEQQEQPRLRGKPVAVVPVKTDRTCCIAASYEAKALGIKTGTNVGQAKSICRALQIVEARPKVYVDYHHRIVEAVNQVTPVDEVWSIDEMCCRLWKGEREPDQALKVAQLVKESLRERIGEFVTCSIGLAPNKFLAKTASNMQKPNGLTLIQQEDIPHKLYSMKLGDLTGIGPRMLVRLESQGITTIECLYQQSEKQLQQIWNSVVGRRWWYQLRGYELPSPPSHRRSLGHSHVLPPKFRTHAGARSIMLRLLHKGAARLRRENYFATRMSLQVSFIGNARWKVQSRFGATQDTSTFAAAFAKLWQSFPEQGIPLKTSITFWKLVPLQSFTPSLLPDDQRCQRVSETMDAINHQFGIDTVYLGAMHDAQGTAPARIAFMHIPDVEKEGPTNPKDLQHWELK